PNCSAEVRHDVAECPRCGYRPELAREYFWLYAGGLVVIAGGFALGILSLIIGNPGPDHWSRPLEGWFPLAPLGGQRWIAFLSAGVLFTLAGLGLTRHRWSAWWLLVLLLVWELGWTARKLITGEPGEPNFALAAALLATELLGLALAARLALALRRTPPRDIRRLQAPVTP